MIILPCSMGTLAAIANGLASNLIQRAADVCLKERRPLILCVRETPFNRIHLRNMQLAADAGATIFPVIPTLYNLPQTTTEMARQFVDRVLAHIGLPQPGAYQWQPARLALVTDRYASLPASIASGTSSPHPASAAPPSETPPSPQHRPQHSLGARCPHPSTTSSTDCGCSRCIVSPDRQRNQLVLRSPHHQRRLPNAVQPKVQQVAPAHHRGHAALDHPRVALQLPQRRLRATNSGSMSRLRRSIATARLTPAASVGVNSVRAPTSAGKYNPALSYTTSRSTISGWSSASFSAIHPPIDQPPTSARCNSPPG